MTKILRMIIIAGSAAIAAACVRDKAPQDSFKYTIDSFADIKVMRFRVPGWDALSLRQKEYAYHLSEAAKWGRDIT